MHGLSLISDRVHRHAEVVFKAVLSHVMEELILLELRMNCAMLAIDRMIVRNVEKDHVQLIGKRDHLENVQHHVAITELRPEQLLAKKYWTMGKFED